MMMNAPPTTNPYVGPRTFQAEESDRFFGREREARDLLSLVIAERVTLFYAQSGAGKSSLINTRLIPGLREAGFLVFPVTRVSGDPPPGVGAVNNVFIYNVLLRLNQAERDATRFTQLTLSHFLANLTTSDGAYFFYSEGEAQTVSHNSTIAAVATTTAEELVNSPTSNGDLDDADIEYTTPAHVLIIDQFEEILTTHLDHWPERAAFFRQLDAALSDDPLLWVVLVLREDYVAALDPYAPLLPGHLRARFAMQRMNYRAALEAVRQPADKIGQRPFAPGVAEELVDNLRLVQKFWQDDQPQTAVKGEDIEPVQLQVVCYQLWERLQTEYGLESHPDSARTITAADLYRLAGDQGLAHFVNQALAAYYEQAITKIIQTLDLNVSERELRDWFSTKLITAEETRGLVHEGDDVSGTGGLPNGAVRLLADQFLIRAESRAGGVWYELVHDRFVQPILQANRAWEVAQGNPLTAVTRLYIESGRDPQRLLRGKQLEDAQTYVHHHPRNLRADEQEFLKASESRQIDEMRQEVAVRHRRLTLLISAICLILLFAGLAYWGWTSANKAAEQTAATEQQKLIALEQKQIALEQKQIAINAQSTAEANYELAKAQLVQAKIDEAKQLAFTGVFTAAIKAYIDAARLDQTQDFVEEKKALTIALLIQEGERRAAQGDLQNASAKFQKAWELKPLPNTSYYIWIPPGEFVMGSSSTIDIYAEPKEQPQHQVYEAGFWILSTEVTNAQYARCVRAKQCTPPNNSDFNQEDKANRPVTQVKWNQANDYTRWVGGRLPSEAEWEKACRGVSGQIYSWASGSPSIQLLNYQENIGTVTDVGRYPQGASPYGAYDMLGNVWEWTRSIRQPYPYLPYDGREEPAGKAPRIKRGAAFAAPAQNTRCAKRTEGEPDYQDLFTGFRTVIASPAQLLYEEGSKLAWQGDRIGAQSEFEKLLQLDPLAGIQPDRETNRIAAQGLIERGKITATNNIEYAIGLYQEALIWDPMLNISPTIEAQRVVGQWFLDKGLILAKSGDIITVTAQFSQALTLAPKLEADLKTSLEISPSIVISPEMAAKRAVARELIAKGAALARGGFIQEAMDTYQDARNLDQQVKFAGKDLNILCRYGSLYGLASTVLQYCDLAVAAEPRNGEFHDSRGLAHALIGDIKTAIEEFTIYAEWTKGEDIYDTYGQQRMAWVAELQAGRNPLDPETLKGLQ